MEDNVCKTRQLPVWLVKAECGFVFCFLSRVQEQEKIDLLESYRALSDEAEKLDSTVQQSLGESSSVRMEMAAVTQVLVVMAAVTQVVVVMAAVTQVLVVY